MATQMRVKPPFREGAMLATTTAEDQVRRPELLWVGSGGWVACDPAVDPSDPHRVVAYLECKDERVYLLWVTGSGGVREFASLREALDQISLRLAAPIP
jgi:hypothetical protein